MSLCVSGDTNSHHGGQFENANGMVNGVLERQHPGSYF